MVGACLKLPEHFHPYSFPNHFCFVVTLSANFLYPIWCLGGGGVSTYLVCQFHAAGVSFALRCDTTVFHCVFLDYLLSVSKGSKGSCSRSNGYRIAVALGCLWPASPCQIQHCSQKHLIIDYPHHLGHHRCATSQV